MAHHGYPFTVCESHENVSIHLPSYKGNMRVLEWALDCECHQGGLVDAGFTPHESCTRLSELLLCNRRATSSAPQIQRCHNDERPSKQTLPKLKAAANGHPIVLSHGDNAGQSMSTRCHQDELSLICTDEEVPSSSRSGHHDILTRLDLSQCGGNDIGSLPLRAAALLQ